MDEFDRSREELRGARDARDQAAAAIGSLQQALKRLSRQRTELDRVFDRENERHVAERARLEREQRGAEEELGRQRGVKADAVGRETAAIRDFTRFTDLRQAIERLNDRTPILLMPVRLETRFKTSASVAGAAGIPQLWVRVFPDDCWIDSFDPVLTDNEVANGKAYWAGIWMAGGFEAQECEAWRTLVESHGSGRAAWIVDQFKPITPPDKPGKPRAQDIILTIGTETPLSGAEAAAAGAFWKAAWLADGDTVKTAAAQSAFEDAPSETSGVPIGAARAAEIAAAYGPVNFSSPLPSDTTKDQVNVSVAFVVFPSVDTKQAAWSQAPKATILPDRFVFIGYESANDASPVIAIGNHVTSPLFAGPDPAAAEADQIRHDKNGNVIVPEELLWLSDFDRAVEVGMGFRINLTPAQASRGFKRVLVVGLRLAADENQAKTELETLLRHHASSRTGLAIVPQGTPTNNTEATNSGSGRLDDPNESFDDLKGPLFTTQTDWLDKRDGQWVAEMLGVDAKIFERAHQAGATDQRAARAMHAALWPATLGYWMESMMAPVFPADVVVRTREFFSRYVVAGGTCPAIRIGSQPYGILPATPLSRMAWLNQATDEPTGLAIVKRSTMLPFLRRLYPLLRAIDADFNGMLPDVSFVGKPGDAGAMLLDIVGLHSGSVEWSQRYAESLKTLFNRAKLQGFGGIIEAMIASAQRAAARGNLTRLGYGGDKTPPILDLVFNRVHQHLKGGVVDDVPLSESERLRAATTDGRNYLQWLIDASGTSLDALYQQQGFTDDKTPTALLYLFLRHALQLGYHDVSIRLHENAGLYDPAAVQRARLDDPFIHIRNNQLVSESRYEPLYAVQPQITGGNLAVHEFIAAQISVLSLAFYLREQRAALERLKGESTARLERVFADHMDCCSYRLDAWLLGIVNFQLCAMRNVHDGVATPPRQGVYLGAYAWLEDVAPEDRVLTPVRLTDPDLIEKFGDPAEPPLMRDSQNQGYVHAPSLNHGVAAAVLRSGFISNASPANRQTLAVNLTSERVRTSLAMIEGIRTGQSLSDLLGYQFERGLHDRHSLAEVDKFIYKLRRAFPIRADRLASTKPPEGVSIESIEARNVVNGLSLVEHVKATNNKIYPFGKTGLPTASVTEAAAINAEVDRLLESHDAVADLALAEGVYQAVLGNYERVASTYDAYARGNFPPEPDVVRTPQSGIGLTHRVALHLESGVNPAVSPVPGLPAVPMTPRAQGEPALNKWLATMMPPLEDIACLVTYRDAATGATAERQVTLRDLRLQPADLILLVSDDPNQAMTELDDRIVRHALVNFGARPDVPPTIRYRGTDTAKFSIFECLPLVRSLRSLTTRSRALRSSDLTLMNEAEGKQDSHASVDENRLTLVQTAMDTLRQDLEAFKAAVDVFLADTVAHRADIISAVDTYVTDISTLFARAATFGVRQAGWGFAYDFRRRTYAAVLDQFAARVKRWDDKLLEFNARLADDAAAATEEARLDLLSQAERAISTIVTAPPPAAAVFRLNLTTVTQPAFVAKHAQLDGVKNSTRTSLTLLLSDVNALLPVSDFDSEPFTLVAHEEEVIRFAEDVSRVAGVVIGELKRRLAAVVPLFAEHDGSAVAATRLRALEGVATTLIGEDFRIIPEFNLSPAQGDELFKALDASATGPLFDYLKNPPEPERDPLDFPVDTWMYGVARVREKMHAWEQVVMMSGALGKMEPDLTALQLPFIPDDRWLGLEVPPTLKLDTDRLLYTAHLSAGFDKTLPQCGLLFDEWTEMIPLPSIDTGVTFHHDRPNCEAPQSMLLVTPAEFRGSWQWADLVDALNETLDFAKRRAIEPENIDNSPYGPFLPATIVATQVSQLTMALELGLNNKIALAKNV